MRSWYLSLPLACVLAQVAVAQVQVQVQQGNAQVVPAQVQIAPVQINPIQMQAVAADLVIAKPGYAAPGASLTQADAVVVGRIVAMEPMDVDASAAPGAPNQKYRVAIVQISDGIHGVKKDVQMVRVAFIPQGNNVPPVGGGIQIQPAIQPAIQPFPGGRRPFIPNVQLDVGQDGMFLLTKHHKESFYLVAGYNGFVTRQNNPNFDNEVKTAKQLAKVMGDPIGSLKSEDRDVRYTAAAVLIQKYRQPANPQGKPLKAQKVDAAESQLILKALAGADWKAPQTNPAIPGPFQLFNQLGITANDGYKLVNPRTQQDYIQAMQKFLDENNGKYVINRLVVDENAKGPGIIQPGVDIPVRPPIKGRPPIKIQPLPAPVQPLPAPAPGAIQILPAPAVDLPLPVPAPVPAPDVKRN